ncbi:MAG: methylenetetrahydrofolate reductase C-terminal domain-containing protein [Desulfobacterales bacterium]|nr:methylenetetrahydrofolate reductase C-terminal domain-containing protein [Desulfobacterales bacterium]
MITAEQKPIQEIIQYIKPYGKILLVGCNECVTVCSAGGRKEVGLLASALHLDSLKQGKNVEIVEITLERQCDPEYVEELAPVIEGAECIVSMACGCGVQTVAARYNIPVFPAVNTRFMGASEAPGVWAERCKGCGNCVLGITGGICPIARCSKHLMNGPCGGTSFGQCEIGPETDCAWRLIWERMVELGIQDRYEELMEAKDWRPGGASGPGKIIREDLQ